MDSKPRGSVDRVYIEFEPSMEWDHDDGSDTLLMFLPGFAKEQLKVQVTSSRKLRVRGERLLEDNKWSHFLKEFPIPANCDTNGISAKFEGGILYVKQPKTITPIEQTTIPTPTKTTPPEKETPTTTTTPPPPTTTPPPAPVPTTTTPPAPVPTTTPPTTTTPPPAPVQKPLKEQQNIKNVENRPQQEMESPEKIQDKKEANHVGKEGVKSEASHQNGNITSKHEEENKKNGLVQDDAKVEKEETGDFCGRGKSRLGSYKNTFCDIIERSRRPRSLTDLVVAVLVFLLVGLYLYNVNKSCEREEPK